MRRASVETAPEIRNIGRIWSCKINNIISRHKTKPVSVAVLWGGRGLERQQAKKTMLFCITPILLLFKTNQSEYERKIKGIF